MTVDLPVAEGDIDVTVERERPRPSRRAAAPGATPDHRRVLSEIARGDYRRTFKLLEQVDRDAIAAALRNGVLIAHGSERRPRPSPRKIADPEGGLTARLLPSGQARRGRPSARGGTAPSLPLNRFGDTRRSSSASSMTGIPSFAALSALLPGDSPATT